MIPKKIHYCWFGRKPLPALSIKCIASWKKYCPDYEIIRWDESNYDFEKHPFMKQAYEAKKWAFLTDYARLDIIYQYGGIYLDTDVELLQPLEKFLAHSLFLGFENEEHVNTGLGFGAVAEHPVVKILRDDYDNVTFSYENPIPCTVLQSRILKNTLGLKPDFGEVQYLGGGIAVYPEYFFSPKNDSRLPCRMPGAYSVHHYMASWCKNRMNLIIKKRVKQIILFLFQKHAGFIVEYLRNFFNGKRVSK